MNEELLRKAQQAGSADELLEMAKENGVNFSEQQVRDYYTQIHTTGELSDDELNAVSGGCGENPPKPYCSVCGTALGSITVGGGYFYYCSKCDKQEPFIHAVMK